MFERLPLDEVYGLLEPAPVVLLGTMARGRPNAMTMSWHMMGEFTPPLVACVVSEGDDIALPRCGVRANVSMRFPARSWPRR